MNVNWKAVQLIAATQVAALALAGCAQLAPTGSGVAVPVAPKNVVVAHAAGAQHAAQPKRLDVVTEIDMHEFSFTLPGAQASAVIKVPANKTVGLHLHNEGAVMHELVIGRKPVEFAESVVDGKKVSVQDGYAKMLFNNLNPHVSFY